MKRIIHILVLIILASFMQAQAEHLKFMGIPLTGTITQFQQKLAAKGVTYSKAESERAAVGTRIFKGTFAGSKATIVVWYNSKTKIVYGAKALFEFSTTKSRDNKYDELKSMLSYKYSDESSETEYKDGLETYHMTVTDDYGYSKLGIISLYRTENEFSYSTYYVHIEYTDIVNYNNNQDSLMKDL